MGVEPLGGVDVGKGDVGEGVAVASQRLIP